MCNSCKKLYSLHTCNNYKPTQWTVIFGMQIDYFVKDPKTGQASWRSKEAMEKLAEDEKMIEQKLSEAKQQQNQFSEKRQKMLEDGFTSEFLKEYFTKSDADRKNCDEIYDQLKSRFSPEEVRSTRLRGEWSCSEKNMFGKKRHFDDVLNVFEAKLNGIADQFFDLLLDRSPEERKQFSNVWQRANSTCLSAEQQEIAQYFAEKRFKNIERQTADNQDLRWKKTMDMIQFPVSGLSEVG
jgi:hypothetical protein